MSSLRHNVHNASCEATIHNGNPDRDSFFHLQCLPMEVRFNVLRYCVTTNSQIVALVSRAFDSNMRYPVYRFKNLHSASRNILFANRTYYDEGIQALLRTNLFIAPCQHVFDLTRRVPTRELGPLNLGFLANITHLTFSRNICCISLSNTSGDQLVLEIRRQMLERQNSQHIRDLVSFLTHFPRLITLDATLSSRTRDAFSFYLTNEQRATHRAVTIKGILEIDGGDLIPSVFGILYEKGLLSGEIWFAGTRRYALFQRSSAPFVKCISSEHVSDVDRVLVLDGGWRRLGV